MLQIIKFKRSKIVKLKDAFIQKKKLKEAKKVNKIQKENLKYLCLNFTVQVFHFVGFDGSAHAHTIMSWPIFSAILVAHFFYHFFVFNPFSHFNYIKHLLSKNIINI